MAPNRTRSKAQPLIERGAQWRDTPRELAAAADMISSMVTDDQALVAITVGPQGLVASLEDGKVYVHMSTVSPRASRQLAERVDSLVAQMLDAPVSGSIPRPRAERWRLRSRRPPRPARTACRRPAGTTG